MSEITKRGTVELTAGFIVKLILAAIIVFMLFFMLFKWLSAQ